MRCLRWVIRWAAHLSRTFSILINITGLNRIFYALSSQQRRKLNELKVSKSTSYFNDQPRPNYVLAILLTLVRHDSVHQASPVSIPVADKVPSHEPQVIFHN